MRAGDRRVKAYDWLTTHVVEVAFMLLAAGWLWYVLRLTRKLYFWSDDLVVIQQAGSWDRLLKPYNGALSLTSLLIDRGAAELGHFSYTPFMIAGVLSILAVPVSYFFTTKRQFGPPLAAILAMSLLWYDGMSLRPAGLNHFLALVGGIFCAAALNRGRRADGIIAAALLFSLCSAGGGLVVAGACLVHNVLVRPPLRRWLAVLVPLALYGVWWVLSDPAATANGSPTIAQTARIVRELCLLPFYHAAFGIKPLGVVLLVAFLVWGLMQLRHGLAAGANFVAWSAAMVGWALALVRSRGGALDTSTFRYAYLSLGFALLAVVPRRPISWPVSLANSNRRWLAAAAVVVLVLGGARALDARSGLQEFARQNTELGLKAKGTMLVLGLGPDVIPDGTPIIFFGFGNPHGTAGQARALMDRYGSPFNATPATADQKLVDLDVARARVGSFSQHRGCRALGKSLKVKPTSFGEAQLGMPVAGVAPPTPGPFQHRLWSSKPFTVDVRRYGVDWVRLADAPANHDVFLTLPVLNTEGPWEIRANGACLDPYVPPTAK